MIKEYYNIWTILIAFAILFSNIVFKKSFDFESPFQSQLKLYSTPTDKIALKNGGPITAVVDPTFATICNTEELQLTASGGSHYNWLSSPGNPSGGVLSAYDIPDPVFSNGFPGAFYVYDVVVTDTHLSR